MGSGQVFNMVIDHIDIVRMLTLNLNVFAKSSLQELLQGSKIRTRVAWVENISPGMKVFIIDPMAGIGSQAFWVSVLRCDVAGKPSWLAIKTAKLIIDGFLSRIVCSRPGPTETR